MPVEYIKRINEFYGKRGMKPLEFARHDSAPLTPLSKPLGECRIGLISSGGVYHSSQPAYQDLDDLTYREIPKDVDLAELKIHHVGYDHTDAEKDVNIVFPVTRLRELEKEGFIGALASPCYTFMGRIYSRLRLLKETGPDLAKKLKENSVDACLIVPA